MILIICVDNNMGLLFNKRRQSMDSVLRSRILSISADSTIWMNSYSYGQFEHTTRGNIKVDENFLNKASSGEYCFVENLDPFPFSFEKIIMYKWNTVYPADMFFRLSADKWRLCHSAEFQGSSHPKLTEEIYCR